MSLDYRQAPSQGDMPEDVRLQFEREQRVERIRRHVARCSASGCSEHYRTGLFTLDTFTTSPAVTAAKEWLTGLGERPSLILTGPVGCGKSHIAEAAIAVSLGNVSARFITGPDLVRSIQSAFKSADESEADAVIEFTAAPRLAIDDIDKVTPSPFVLRSLWSIVDARVRHERPTIYTANSDMRGLYKRLAVPGYETDAQAIVDRIIGSCVQIVMTGKSHRSSI